MKDVVLGLLGAAGVGAGVYCLPFDVGNWFGPDSSDRPVYAMDVDEAADLLTNADMRKGRQPFLMLDVTPRREGDVIRFRGSLNGGTIDCTAQLRDVGGGEVSVTNTCDRKTLSKGIGAKISLMIDKHGFRELVDATLAKRPFNEEQVIANRAGFTLEGWQALKRRVGEDVIEENLQIERERAAIEFEKKMRGLPLH